MQTNEKTSAIVTLEDSKNILYPRTDANAVFITQGGTVTTLAAKADIWDAGGGGGGGKVPAQYLSNAASANNILTLTKIAGDSSESITFKNTTYSGGSAAEKQLTPSCSRASITITYVPQGGVTSAFAGSLTTVTSSSTALEVSAHTGTLLDSSHTHSVTFTPGGTISATFTGSSHSHSYNAPSLSFEPTGTTDDYRIVFNISSGTTGAASPEGSVSATFSGTKQTITSASSTINSQVNIAAQTISGHTHSISFTPAGTVTSTFTGTTATISSGTTTTAESVTIDLQFNDLNHTHTVTLNENK